MWLHALFPSSICCCIADGLYSCCFYRGWWNWYHGRPVGGTAVRCCLQTEERPTASRYSVTHRTLNLQMSQNMYKTVKFHSMYIFFAIKHTCRTWGLSSSLFYDSVSFSTQQQICLCSLSVFHLLYGSQTELCFSFSHGYGGQSWFQQWLAIQQVKRDRVPRVGTGSMKRSNWWGVVVGLEDIEGILM